MDSEAAAYASVLAAVRDSIGSDVVRVQPHAILVGGYASAPGDKIEHFVADPSAAIAEAVEVSSANWELCGELGAGCLTGGAGNVLGLSALARRDEGADVWITLARIPPSGSGVSWEIRYYKVVLHSSDGRWTADPPVLLDIEH